MNVGAHLKGSIEIQAHPQGLRAVFRGKICMWVDSFSFGSGGGPQMHIISLQCRSAVSFYLPTTQMKVKSVCVCVPGGGINIYFENYYSCIIILAIMQYTLSRATHSQLLISHTPHTVLRIVSVWFHSLFCHFLCVDSSYFFRLLFFVLREMIVMSNRLFVGIIKSIKQKYKFPLTTLKPEQLKFSRISSQDELYMYMCVCDVTFYEIY